MMIPITTLEQLHAHRRALFAEWMRRVKAARADGLDHTQFSAIGPVLTTNNELWYFVRLNGRHVYDLRIDAAGVIHEDR